MASKDYSDTNGPSENEKNEKNAFPNDGSFLTQFLKSPTIPQASYTDEPSLTSSPSCNKYAVASRHAAVCSQIQTNSSDNQPLFEESAAATRRKRKFCETPRLQNSVSTDSPETASHLSAPTPSSSTNNNSSSSSKKPFAAGTVSDIPKPTAAEVQADLVSHLNLDSEISAKEEADIFDKKGSVDGGTWEHRKRAKEMILTANLSAVITQVSVDAKIHNKGAGIGGYLPPELESALQSKFTAAQKNDTCVDSSDILSSVTSGKSIGSRNKGYQMLQQSGWTEGTGLGKDGSGIAEPLAPLEKKMLGKEFGSAKPTSSEDDQFDQYRKRMMLAYRFRPNPLNNPRRSYDGYQTLYDSKTMNSVISKVEELHKNLPGK